VPLTLLDLPDFGPSNSLDEVVRAINDRLRRIAEAVGAIDGGGSTTTIIRDRTTTTVAGGAQVVIYKPLTASETIGAPSLEQVPVGALVLYILRQPAGNTFAIAWASAFKGHPGSVPLRSNTYSAFRFYRVSEAELLLVDIPLRGEGA
jgi:hypothetical protein